jgi:Tol biopolymer transport system component
MSPVPLLGTNEVVVYGWAESDGAPVSLYAVGTDGTPTLLDPKPINCCASVSRDGTLVAFEAPSADGKHANIGLVRTDGSDLRTVAPASSDTNLSPVLFLPDGRLVAVTWTDPSPGPTSLIALDPAASDPLATQTTIAAVSDGPLAVSPDGTKMLIALAPDAATPGQLLVVSTDGSGQQPFSPQAVNVGDDPFWGPAAGWSLDGSKVTFSTGPEGSRTTYVANADGSNVTSIGSSLTGAQWSPAQDLLAVDRQTSTGNGIVIVQPDGTVVATIAPSGAFGPTWSPDGTRVVYQQGIRTNNLTISDLAGQTSQITNDSGQYEWVGWGKLP